MLPLFWESTLSTRPRACIRQTLETARRTSFPLDRIIFKFTEVERLDTGHLLNILRSYSKMGFRTAIDDFGAGYAGLSLLAKFQPDFVNLDMDLIPGIDVNTVKQIVVRRTLGMLHDLGVTPICEGVETAEELAILLELGVDFIQGYFVGRPVFEGLGECASLQQTRFASVQ